MKLAEKKKSLTKLKTHTEELIEELNEGKSPFIVTKNGRPMFVILDLETYDRLKNDHSLLKMVARSETPVELDFLQVEKA